MELPSKPPLHSDSKGVYNRTEKELDAYGRSCYLKALLDVNKQLEFLKTQSIK